MSCKNSLCINHDKLQSLALAYTEGFVTNERLRYVLKMHKADIYDLLKLMCKDGFLFSEGHGRGTKYYLLDNTSIKSNFKRNLERNLESNFKRRMSKEELRNVIIETCSEWVSLEYISKAIGRNPYYLLNDIIPSMLADGLIERMYPNAPRYPNQKYKRI